MTTINLSWPANPASEGVLNYRLQQSVNGGAFSLLTVVTTPSFEIVNPSPGVYQWKVSAVNFVGEGPLGAVASGPDVPSVPGTITVTITNS